LEIRDQDREAKLRAEIMLTYEEMMADPSKGVPMNEVFDRVEARLKTRLSTGENPSPSMGEGQGWG